ncbi:MAG: twin-arginine translocation signal domain-containing protein [Acetobacteraceae bacterium]
METSRRKFLQGSSTIATAGMMLGLASGKAQTAERKPTLDPSDWTSVRAQFNLDPKLAHLANFFLASYPAPVREAIERYRDALNANPYSYLDDHMFMQTRDMLWRNVAKAAAEYVGGKPDEITLTARTTWGLSLIYSGLQLRPG